MEFIVWPYQPSRLFAGVQDLSSVVVIISEQGLVWYLTLRDNQIVSAPPISDNLLATSTGSSKTMVSSSIYSSESILLGCCSNGQYISIAVKGKNQKSTSKSTGGVATSNSKKQLVTIDANSSPVSILTWRIFNTSGSCRLLTADSAVKSILHMNLNEYIVAMCNHTESKTLSLLLNQNHHTMTCVSESSRWLKFDHSDGMHLFERVINNQSGEHLVGEVMKSNKISTNYMFLLSECYYDYS